MSKYERLYSVIVPVFNAETTLDRCVRSVLNQTYRNFELILVDDGSSDSSIEMIKHYRSLDHRIIDIYKDNSGVSSTRNVGLQNAMGDYVVFLDSDDYLSPDYLERFNAKNADVIICGYRNFGDSAEVEIPAEVSLTGTAEIAAYINENFSSCLIRTPWAKAIMRSVLTSNRLRFNESMRLAEDVDFNCRLFKVCKSLDVISGGV